MLLLIVFLFQSTGNNPLLASLSMVIITVVAFSFGFASSPDVRPPLTLPWTKTVRPVLLPLGISVSALIYDAIESHHTVSDYICSGILVIWAFLVSVWLLGAFAARKTDLHYQSKSRKWHNAWKKYHHFEEEKEET